MSKIAAFEAHAEAYDAWFDRHADAYRAELEAVRRLLPAGRAPARAVEIGVGSGLFAQPLGVGLGVEPSPAMAARARARGIEVLEGPAEALPLPDAAFDLALMVTTICFVDDPAAAVAEAARVLAPGGRLIVGFVDAASELGQRYERQRAHSKFYGEATFFTAREVLDLMARAGLRFAGGTQTLTGDPPPHAVLPTPDLARPHAPTRGAFLALAGFRG